VNPRANNGCVSGGAPARGDTRRAPRRLLAVVCVALVVVTARPSHAGIRIEQDELVFTLHAPGAQEVYLVGDFNLWNPTVERMSANGDDFEVRLFLVAGEYRYKFVVDGKWIADPDNPGSAEKGSPIKLIERSGGLILDTDRPETGAAAAHVHGWLRYIGALRVDDGDGEGVQRVDAEVQGSYARLAARARVATDDSSWTWSPPAIDAYFDRGRVDLDFGRIDVRGLENDSTWASSDPMALVGDAGVFGYDAGFGRHGVAAVATASKGALRVFYADATTGTPRPAVTIPASALAAFAGGAAADTTVYDYAYTFDDSDVLALDATATVGGFDLGVARREDLGINPGVLASVVRGPSGFTTTAYATREDRSVTNAWLRARDLLGLRITGAYGQGDCDVHAFASESVTGVLPPTIAPGVEAAAVEARVPIMDTQRALFEVSTPVAAASVRLRWDGTRFDFDGVEGASRADVQRVVAEGTLPWRGWSLRATLTYTDARYGDTPDALYLDWPERNPWLQLWDGVDEPSIVGLGLESHDVLAFAAEKDSGRTEAGVALRVQLSGWADEVRHASARAFVQTTLRERWTARADARMAWYDGTTSRASDTTWDGYLEAGYAWNGISLNLGVGFDPVVFDPVGGDYADIGRTEYLRGAIDDDVRRSRASRLLESLRGLETSLEELDTIKLECVIQLD
jgi:Glycogen recognition site of AMP-activated protein kinase